MNSFKDPAAYAPLEHRMAMGNILAKHYPGKPFVMSDIEESIGSHLTCNVLDGLKARFPDDKFIWTMGADNLVDFHKWENYDRIINNFPIAVLDRAGYTEQAKNSVTAKTYPHLNIADAKALATAQCGWCFLNNPPLNMSSTALLNRMRAGERKFDGPMQDVIDYIVQNGLYNIDVKPAQPPGPQPV